MTQTLGNPKEFFTALGQCGGKPGEPPPPLTANAAIAIRDRPMAEDKAAALFAATGSPRVFADICSGIGKQYAAETIAAMQEAKDNVSLQASMNSRAPAADPATALKTTPAPQKQWAGVITAPTPNKP